VSLLDEKKERPLQLIRDVLSIFLLALTVILQLFGLWETLPLLIRSIIWIGVGSIILFLMIPRAIRLVQVKYHRYVTRKRQDRVLAQLKELVDNGLNELFASELQHSLIHLIRDLPSTYINNQEIHVKLSYIADKFNILTDWRTLLVQSLKNPGIIHQDDRFQKTIHDVTRFHYSLGDVARELNALDLPCDSSRPRNKQTERIVVDKYNYYVSRLEETIKSANKLGTNLPSPSFTRLELK